MAKPLTITAPLTHWSPLALRLTHSPPVSVAAAHAEPSLLRRLSALKLMPSPRRVEEAEMVVNSGLLCGSSVVGG